MIKYFAIVATMIAFFSSCSQKTKVEHEDDLKVFINNLDNPKSFEFVEWTDYAYDIKVSNKDTIKMLIKELIVERDNAAKKAEKLYKQGKITESFRYDDLKDDIHHQIGSLVLFEEKDYTYHFRSGNKRLDLADQIKYYYLDYSSMWKNQKKLIINGVLFLDKIPVDTVAIYKTFKYRATNKHNALELMEGEIKIK